MHDEDTNKFHLILLAILNKLDNYYYAKRVRNFLDIDRLKERENTSENNNNINKHILEWILGGCSLEDNHYTIKEVEDIINKATELFMENRDKRVELNINNKKIDTIISFKELIDMLNKVHKDSK